MILVYTRWWNIAGCNLGWIPISTKIMYMHIYMYMSLVYTRWWNITGCKLGWIPISPKIRVYMILVYTRWCNITGCKLSWMPISPKIHVYMNLVYTRSVDMKLLPVTGVWTFGEGVHPHVRPHPCHLFTVQIIPLVISNWDLNRDDHVCYT
ncbi:hypothetical protein AVEN_242149-1 [Araneus ventricosus]|uniref:Uncharacterized protein n=1 Tax=Araneus ventricosus TaxID=182803 RepID=A0A4Y2DGE2_ARAVE|nr:hypothetical protein AVEN_242149-1 [Araneus ventricosus]